ncbi:MAG: glycosyl hydrolase [Chitinophagaceae bacterium]|nr:glycosyl hydrolase [Chitinophagaceae bacterium]
MKHVLMFAISMAACISLTAQNSSKKKTTPAPAPSVSWNDHLQGMQWRNLGPTRGGRSVACSGVPGQPLIYYMGSTGGGVWKTEDAGISWRNISDGFFNTGSVGAIAVAESDPNVVYVGMGEHTPRGVMTSAGDGVYKSTDAGKTWQHIGLTNTMHIAAIRIHPSNPDVVYVAAQGAIHGPTAERGIYKTTDGGRSWDRVLFVDDNTGCADLSMDMSNPRILYAGMWDHRRLPWLVRSGGPGSGLYKSTDGGNTWHKMSEGLPANLGKVAIDVSRANPGRVYANIESEDGLGGVYRSDDGGDSWSQTSKARVTVARAWYYIEIFADPQDQNTVYVLNAPALKSIDGGKTFTNLPTPHGDNHWLWIDPANNKRMINANDGGANISFNGGASWSSQQNQPTAQFYRVIADKQFPYNLYAGQQDNTAVIVPSKSPFGGIDWQQWTFGPGGESAFLAFDPNNPTKVFGGSYQGNIEVLDRKLSSTKDVMASPTIGLGVIPKNQVYRFNWNAPIVADPFNPAIIYHAGNKVLKTTDAGQSWTEISGDLTRNDTAKQGNGGAPFTNEGAGGEVYNTLAYIACSPITQGEIWTGSDDGLVHLTRDGGNTWSNVTPAGLGETLVNSIEVSYHTPGKAIIATTGYKMNDFSPAVFITYDYGKTWSKQTNGFEAKDFCRVVREDRVKKGLLYAGTERGLYISTNDGLAWQRFQLNLPVVAINDLTIADNDLVAATSGRAFWILDDLSPLQQLQDRVPATATLFMSKPTVKTGWGGGSPQVGANPAEGAALYYFLPAKTDSIGLIIRNAKGDTIRQYNSWKNETEVSGYPGGPAPEPLLPTEEGLHKFNWDLRHESLPGIKGQFLNADYRGASVPPGTYSVTLKAGTTSSDATLQVLQDPRVQVSANAYEEQYAFCQQIDAAVTNMHQSVVRMRSVKQQVEQLNTQLKGIAETDTLVKTGKTLIAKINAWEKQIITTQQETFQDVINYYNRLSAELLDLRGRVDNAQQPIIPAGHKKQWQTLLSAWTKYETELLQIINRDLPAFNDLYKAKALPAILLPQ